MRPPTTAWQIPPTITPTAIFTSTSRIPFRGWGRELTKPGLAPQVTPMTISIGMMAAITKMTQLPSVEKSKSEMKPKEMAIIRAVDDNSKCGLLHAILLRGKSGVEIIYHKSQAHRLSHKR